MITREDLQAAIAECQGARNPSANTCIKLAAFLTIQEHLFGDTPADSSFAAPPKSGTISAYSESEFSAVIDGKPEQDVLKIIDELMEALAILSPRLYSATIRKLSEI